MEDKNKLNENKDINEREELYQVFEKEKWYIKLLKKIGLVEDKNEEENELTKKYDEGYDKGVHSGIFSGIVISIFVLIILYVLKVNVIDSSLKNIDEITFKLKEINYYVNKHFLYEKDEDKINDYVALGMMASLEDPYAAYYTKEDVKDLQEQVTGEYYGIGVIVMQDPSDSYLIVTRIYDDSDAKNTSLSIGDKIIKVDDEDVFGYDSDEVVSLVRGKEGTQVKLTILKPDGKTTEDVLITRKKIVQDHVEGKILDNNIGYISIDQFEGKAYEQFIAYKEEFTEKNIKGLIIDLRNNPGGNLDVLQQLANIFLDNKLITYFKFNDNKRIDYYSIDGAWDIPVVILINGYSASASEAFTGALKDHGIATVVGTKSFGKGIVQEIYPLHDGSAIKFTVADYYTPSGVNITGEGIMPDIEVEANQNGEDNQLDVAIKTLMDKINNK